MCFRRIRKLLVNVRRLDIGHSNTNSLKINFDQLKVLVQRKIDILVFTETKIESGLPTSQFTLEGFSMEINLVGKFSYVFRKVYQVSFSLSTSYPIALKGLL